MEEETRESEGAAMLQVALSSSSSLVPSHHHHPSLASSSSSPFSSHDSHDSHDSPDSPDSSSSAPPGGTTLAPLSLVSLDLPIGSVGRIAKSVIPISSSSSSYSLSPLFDGAICKLSAEVKEAMARAGGLFILFIADAAANSARSAARATINSDDVLSALEETEFYALLEPCHDFLVAHRKRFAKDKVTDRDTSKVTLKLKEGGGMRHSLKRTKPSGEETTERRKPGPKKKSSSASSSSSFSPALVPIAEAAEGPSKKTKTSE